MSTAKPSAKELLGALRLLRLAVLVELPAERLLLGADAEPDTRALLARHRRGLITRLLREQREPPAWGPSNHQLAAWAREGVSA